MPDSQPLSDTAPATIQPSTASLSPLDVLIDQLVDQHVLASKRTKPLLLKQLADQSQFLQQAHHYFSQIEDTNAAVSYAAEWLLDNFSLVQNSIRQIREDLPISFYQELPKLASAPWQHYPRCYALAYSIVEFSSSQLNLADLRLFITTYQSKGIPCTIGELWAFPAMLRMALIDSLTNTLRQLMPVPTNAPPASTTRLSATLAADVMVGHCISSLRWIAVQDWLAFFESVSRVEQILGFDPAGIYTNSDFETRNSYRDSVERLASQSGQTEEAIARKSVQLARESKSAGRSFRETHVGYFLIDQGRAKLEQALGYQPTLREKNNRWSMRHPVFLYLSAIGLLSLFIVLLLYVYETQTNDNFIAIALGLLLAIIPASAISIGLVNWLLTVYLPPGRLPRLDFQKGIPTEYRTMVVIPTLLTGREEIDDLLQQLELHYVRNPDPSLSFALLSDFTDAPSQHLPEDVALLSHIQAGIEALNVKYQRPCAPFYVFHRERRWNAVQNTWMGWERKRGKLIEFNRLLRPATFTEPTLYMLQVGDMAVLPLIKYVITLDADTILPEDSAQRLVSALAHPLNRAIYDPASGKVTSGYVILQPRTEIKPVSANQSPFAQIYSGDTGLDLYTHAVSDVYQDLFAEGSYVGKGIYEVDTFMRALADHIPDNTLLSHDLLEGIYTRAALLTDTQLIEDYPARYLANARRLHRWIRGDWQLLPWLLNRQLGAGLSALDRWKIVDNLRRSLVMPALLLLIVAGWLILPGSALLWMLFGLGALATSLVIGAVSRLIALLKHSSITDWRDTLRPIRFDAVRWLLAVIFLPYEALSALHAAAITLLRLFVTHRNLLQWTTAAQTARRIGAAHGVWQSWLEMIDSPLVAIGIGLLVAWKNVAALPVALPLLLAWVVAPQVAYLISQPIQPKQAALAAEQTLKLRLVARQTWLFFEHMIGPDDHWLPPDHFQELPARGIAHRTSPTNIGLLLLSSLAACDLGYIGQLDLIARVLATFETLEKMEHYRGHLLNWYNTQNLDPLLPRYISTVDSGNFAGALIALKQAFLTLPDSPVFHIQRWQGLLDTLALLESAVERLRKNIPTEQFRQFQTQIIAIKQKIQTAQQTLDQQAEILTWLHGVAWPALSQSLLTLIDATTPVSDPELLSDLRMASDRVYHHLNNMRRDMTLLLPWAMASRQIPALFSRADLAQPLLNAWQAVSEIMPTVNLSLRDSGPVCQQLLVKLGELDAILGVTPAPLDLITVARSWCANLAKQLTTTQGYQKTLLADYENLAAQAESFFSEMDFSFLYNAQRQVFHIGYNITTGSLDDNFYDLLASEARLASLLAIAKRDVPQSHWLHLGRPVTKIGSERILLSWSGTMFEYLMPALLMNSYDQTLLTQSCQAVVAHQIAYGRGHNVPWGISESGFYAFGSNMDYQYHAFGVPGLGFKRGLADDLVLTPYASLLALRFDAQAVAQNIDRLDAIQMRGRYGFYEAVDYTHSRLMLRQDHALVRSYMAHHQGMILVSAANYLLDDVMLARFHSDPRVKSVELLLQEKIPDQAPLEFPQLEPVIAARSIPARITIAPWHVPLESAVPQVHVLSNGSFSTLISAAGSGYSFWDGLALNRWKPDTTLDNWGQWIYVQDVDSGAVWSAAYQPTAVTADSQSVQFSPHQVEFQRSDNGIALTLTVTVAATDDVEIRRLTLINHGDKVRRLRLISYGEVVLAPQVERHPAFNKMFVESEYVADINLLIFHRRQRTDSEEPIYLGHTVFADGSQANNLRASDYETDRMRFIGRGMTAQTPAVLRNNKGSGAVTLSRTVGATLDPIMAMSQSVTLAPHATAHLAYLTIASYKRDEVLDLVKRYRNWSVIDNTIESARRQNELAVRKIDLDTIALASIQQLLSALLYPYYGLRADLDVLSANRRGQSALWGHDISGDYPILLVQIDDDGALNIVDEVLKAHTYWRNQQIAVDVVLLNTYDSGYSQELQDQLRRLIGRAGSADWLNRRGGIFMVNADQMSAEDRTLLQTAARAVLDSRQGTLAKQVSHSRERAVLLPNFEPTRFQSPENQTPALERPTDLLFDNGQGGFSPDGKEYVIYLDKDQWTPLPWINVIANDSFGTLVSESGTGYSWAENSGENRLTPWRNDPVSDPPGETLYIRDEETARVWSPVPLPSRDNDPYLIRHGAGYSTFEHHSQGLKQQVQIFVAPDAPVKIIRVHLENAWDRPRRLTLTYFAEWVLGIDRVEAQPYIISEFDHETGSLLARNPYNTEFGERVAFLGANKAPHGLTADRTEFLGRMGDLRRPAALGRVGLSSAVGAGFDPCAALQLHIDLAAGGSEALYFLLGEGTDRAHALALLQRFQNSAEVDTAWTATQSLWDNVLGAVTVKTPDPTMNVMLNRWLLYQTLSCRVWGRSAFFQSSGAFGYRDQLQDVMALLHAAPQLARAHILNAAGHQFEEGDVLHWWHPPSGRGVRTRISDDLLWLPYVVAEYVNATGDSAILDEKVPFLHGEPLKANEDERYAQYSSTDQTFTLYEHCLRAIKCGSTQGNHGLPLMGTGDWNDGLNLVGAKGRGESVWLGWFLYSILMRFAAVCDARNEANQANTFRQRAQVLQTAIEIAAWDGNWYRRAYFDDGTLLGSTQNSEGQIDSIAQSWAVLSGAGNADHIQKAMQAVSERLIRTPDQLLLLLAPPFDKAPNNPGYIRGYPPGIRENGGQYTHAATWVIWAFAQLGQGGEAVRLFDLLNPINHSDNATKVKRYRVEPYVLAADVYSVLPYVGRGGWTWYTGSASWLYRVGIEAILGLRRNGQTLQITPCIPSEWPGFDLTYRPFSNDLTVYEIHIEKSQSIESGVIETTLDGQVIASGQIALAVDGQTHTVQIRISSISG